MFDLFWQNRLEIQITVLVISITAAFWRGNAPERWIAGTFVLMFALDRLYHFVFGPGHYIHGANPGHILIDLVSTALFIGIALIANRVYTLWVAGFQLISTVAHIVRAINPAVATDAYLTLQIAPSYLAIAAFTLGIALHIRREIKFGPYRSWRVSLPRSQKTAPKGRQKHS